MNVEDPTNIKNLTAKEEKTQVYEYLSGSFMVNIYHKGDMISRVDIYNPAEINKAPTPADINAMIIALQKMQSGGVAQYQQQIADRQLKMVQGLQMPQAYLSSSQSNVSSHINSSYEAELEDLGLKLEKLEEKFVHPFTGHNGYF